ncbi:ABC transporter ATP-binding protein [uncultured Enterovirga sp.]|uniref:ABC transporter ATP-binding protein n=1 Tax=uncultured Enterovirga sp. TaxID=2026352 RepID=UPI0035CC0AAA
MAEIRVSHLSKSFDGKNAVRDVSLTVADGEFFSLLGPSGCGKSTLLALLCGLEAPSAGRIHIGGKDVTDIPPKHRGIAMVFQDYALYPHMTTRDNLALPMKAAKASRSEIERRIREVSTVLAIEDFLDSYPRHLSGGQRQRVALGRALVRDPQVFLMDEPLSNLDARLRIQMRTELRLLKERLGATVIYVTHDQAEAMTLSDRMAVMAEGELQQVGTPIALYSRPANRFVASFLGDIGINMMDAILDRGGKGGLRIEGGPSLTLDDPVLGDAAASAPARLPVAVGIRPEHVGLHRVKGTGMADGTVILCEQLGSEQHVHVRMGEHMIVARAPPTAGYQLQDTIFVSFPGEALRIFDRATGRSLAPLSDLEGAEHGGNHTDRSEGVESRSSIARVRSELGSNRRNAG